ncbi:MAG: NACHT domain-containing protein, partial [Cyanobacteria bacterium P01_D01_bin.71]
MASRLWRFLTTDVSELFSGEVITNTADAAGAVFELAEVLQTQGPKVQDLAPLVGQLDTLLDALNSPLAEIVEKSVPFVPIATSLLKFYLEQSKQPLTLEKCVAIVSQSAYLESFKKFLADDAVLEQIGKTSASDALKVKTKQLGDLEISEEEARRTVTKFPVCKLAKHFGDVLKARLQQAGLEETAAQILIERVAWQTPRYMNQVWAASTEAVKHLGQPTFDAWRQEQAKYQSIADYLVEKIEPGPQKSVFNEGDLTFCDIYVPLEVKLLDEKGQPLQDTPPRDLENWVTESLFQTDSLEILFIQGEAGRGKSVFCRMFADWVREILFPAYVPILIPLRSLKVLETTLTETLANALENYDFVSSDTGWLTDDNTRFLFLLDGFDELLLEGRDSGGLKEFLPQVVQFQRNCHHRFLITGRPLSLQGIERVITQAKDDLQRAELQPMSDPLREIWYQQWADKFGQDETEGLKQFLEACPKDVQYGLAREPLLLYLLGRMHRKGRLKAEMFEGTDGTEAKVVIYDEVVRWVIEEQRQNENVRQVGLEPEDLRQAL